MIFIEENAFEKEVCKVLAILFRCQCANSPRQGCLQILCGFSLVEWVIDKLTHSDNKYYAFYFSVVDEILT